MLQGWLTMRSFLRPWYSSLLDMKPVAAHWGLHPTCWQPTLRSRRSCNKKLTKPSPIRSLEYFSYVLVLATAAAEDYVLRGFSSVCLSIPFSWTQFFRHLGGTQGWTDLFFCSKDVKKVTVTSRPSSLCGRDVSCYKMEEKRLRKSNRGGIPLPGQTDVK